MTDPLKKLKNSMKNSIFNDLTFSNERKSAVMASIKKKQPQLHLGTWKEETLIAVFESVQSDAKQGFDISTYLIQKNDISFQKNEGELYSLLHLLETKGILTSKWIEGKKYYSLTTKGKKHLVAYKQESSKQKQSLKDLLTEVAL